MIWRRKKNKKRKLISEAKTIRFDVERFMDFNNENILIGSSSIVGTREEQQDAMMVEKNMEKDYAFAIICDGMGGMSGGSIASSTALNYISNEIPNIIDKKVLQKELLRIVKDTDQLIYGLKDTKGNEIRAGTTTVVAMIKNGLLYWVSVGDSKLYILKKGVMKCITNEHNYGFLVKQKNGDSDFKFNPKIREDALVSYLGAGGLAYVDTNQQPVKLQDGDMMLLCSDGLYKSLSENIIVELLNDGEDMDEIAENLTRTAFINAKGSQDNTTVIVMKYKRGDKIDEFSKMQ